MRLPLTGTTVVSIEQAVAAPFATRQLADLGARVIKIERPDGGDFARAYDTTVKGLSSYFVWLNRSKESLAIDLKSAAGRDVFDRLLARADVFVQNLAPGAGARLGVTTADLRRRYPSLIACDISGYGSSGPMAAKKAYDMLVQAEVGLIGITGTAESPSRVGISVADIAAGMYAFSGVLAALVGRGSTGEGATIEVSLFDALGEWMSAPAYYTEYGGTPPPRTGPAHATIAPYERFTAADGVDIYIAIQNAREWVRFCDDVIHRPDLTRDARFSTNPSRVAHRGDLHAIIATVVEAVPREELVGRLDRAGIAHARGSSLGDFVRHPQLETRGRWRTVDSPAGPLRVLAPPLQFGDVAPRMDSVPALGEHSDAILSELGVDAATIARWRGEGVIA